MESPIETGGSESKRESDKKHSTKKIPFWTENPNVLFQSEYMFEFFPVESMTYSQKLNAITRAIILVSIFLFAVSRNWNILFVFAATMAAVSLVYYNHTPKKKVRFSPDRNYDMVENFENPSHGLARYTIEKEGVAFNPDVFDNSTPTNPFSNVLITDYEYNPQKKPAPASYNQSNSNTILTQAKEFVKTANPDQPDIADKLFKDLGEELQFEQSMRPFYSNPATTVPNDQEAFADFCYGSMVSCKEGNMFACSRQYQTANN